MLLSVFYVGCSVENTALVGRYHVLDVDERVFSAMLLEEFESGLDEVTQVLGFTLGVVDLVAEVVVVCLEQVEDGKDLSVVGHEGFADGVGAKNELLEDLECDLDDFAIAGVQSS